MMKVTKEPTTELVPQQAAVLTPMDMIANAVASGAGIDMLERLMGLQERYEAAQAKKAYIEAKAAFKAENVIVTKDKDNKQYGSKYATIGNLVNTVNVVLAKHGLDASWDIVQAEKITVTCILSHRDGHSERVSMSAAPDGSGQKNPIQQIKSAVTYLRVATFEAITGIATNEGGADDDGNGFGAAPISEDQLNELLALADEVGADKPAFCRWAKVNSFPDIAAKDFDKAKKALEAKRKRANADL
jgi:hypothetical protein